MLLYLLNLLIHRELLPPFPTSYRHMHQKSGQVLIIPVVLENANRT
jgi:hypothetical protein